MYTFANRNTLKNDNNVYDEVINWGFDTQTIIYVIVLDAVIGIERAKHLRVYPLQIVPAGRDTQACVIGKKYDRILFALCGR